MKDERILRPKPQLQLNVDVNLLQLALSRCRSIAENYLVELEGLVETEKEKNEERGANLTKTIGALNDIKNVCRDTLYQVEDYFECEDVEAAKNKQIKK